MGHVCTDHHINQIKNKPQDLLVNTGSATRAARNFTRSGETTTEFLGQTTTEFQHLNIFNTP